MIFTEAFPSIMKKIKYILFIFIIFIFFLFTTELFVRAVRGFKSLPLRVSTGEEYKYDEKKYQIKGSESFVAHPYFGFIRKDDAEVIESLKTNKDKNTFVILLLGGSVAEMFGRYAEFNFIDELKKNIPELRKFKVNFINLAIGGGRQPQQFFIFSYLLENVNLVINIDGFNETGNFPGSNFLPPEYPTFWLNFFSDKKGNLFYLYSGKLCKNSYYFITELPVVFPVLARSQAYYFFWRSVGNALVKLYYKMDELYLESYERGQKPERPKDEVLKERVDIWKKYNVLSAEIAAKNNVQYFDFVHPNQYFPGTKIFDKEEEKIAIDPDRRDVAIKRTVLINDEAIKLRSKGYPIFSLARIYEGIRDPIFKDPCCHVNELGNKIMQENIIKIISKHWRH